MKNIFVPVAVGLFLFSAFSVQAAVPQLQSQKLSEGKALLGNAKWIEGETNIPESDSLFYLDNPSPLFRTQFGISEQVEKAEMFITAAGYYETWINGKRVGDQQLDPAWTNFGKRVYVTRLDVTSLVRKGKNSWGIMLGNGFYNPLPLRMWGGKNLRNALTVGKPCVIGLLVVTFKDGSQVNFCTSDKWITHNGPVTRNSVYLGEWYDSRKEVQGWCEPGSKLKGWQAAKVSGGPGGNLQLSDFPPIRITKWLDPLSIKQDEKSGQIIDFGQNFTGLIRVKIKAEAGDTVRFRYGELLYPSGLVNTMTTACGQIKRAGVGGPGAPAVAEQIDVYIAKGKGMEIFQPRFTFHGFRYVEITGLRHKLAISDIQAGRINSDVQEAGKILGSSGYLNQLNKNCQWTFLSNLQSVQSDCPAREKFGYGGDINAVADAYTYNYNMHDIYRKMIFDWVDAMKPDHFVDTAPFVGIEYCGLSWESAFLFLQNALFVHYGDYSLVKEMYKTDQAWMDKVAKIHPNFVVDNGLSDHESLAKVPVELTGTCHYFQVALIMKRFAEVAGDNAGIARYSKLANNIRDKIIDLFWDTPSIDVPNKQTLLATLLASGVLGPEDRKVAMNRLLEVMKIADYHVSTGIFGTKYLLEALSSNGRSDVAYRIVNQSGFPGWKYMIDNGATTIWETWKESDNTFSQNHPMFGSVSEWYLKWLGGIQPDQENPGLNKATLRPQPIPGLDSINCERYFPSGKLVSRWWWTGKNLFLEFTIPEGLGTVWIPEEGMKNIQSKVIPLNWNQPDNQKGTMINLNTPGRYVFEIPDYANLFY